MHRAWVTPLSLLAGASAVAAECTFDAFTSMLADKSDVSVNFAEAVPANGSFGQGKVDLPFPDNATQLPALCAVGINVQSSANSSYNFGLFLPEEWNNRFMTTGNGGYGGGINWPDMGHFSHYGFSSMSTDTGHNATAEDGSWGFDAPESLVDWGHRAMHGSIVLAKEIIKEYYTADAIKYSYYASCSTGGRQGLKEIQEHPDSFDGISVGAPAWWSVHLASSTLWMGLLNTPEDGPGHVDTSLMPVIAKEMVRQCDPQDGVTDGIISDPFGCDFNFEAMLCKPSSDSSTCLTPAQLTTAYKFYNDWVDTNQTYVFPGASIGTDGTFLLGSVNSLGSDFYQYWIYNNTNFDYTQVTYKDVQFADTINPGNATADNFDMSPFQARGGKIMHYHGGADSLIPTGSSQYFRKQVEQTLVPQGVELDDFYRYYLIPGMDHCSGSAVASPSAPWYVAGGSQAVTGATHGVPGFEDADHDIVLALMRWVEEDGAPDQLIATKFVNDTVALGVDNQRPICPFPKQAKYTSGDVKDASSWECQAPY
ncbi:tannase and feruloyl esterase [Xylariomycetidae sp. FL0641]|nr:tannase and feruloyl esterase [Xylariomycetidae sp. FL0641]